MRSVRDAGITIGPGSCEEAVSETRMGIVFPPGSRGLYQLETAGRETAKGAENAEQQAT